MKTGSTEEINTKEGKVLKKEEVNPEQVKEKMPLNGLLIGGGILAAFIGMLIYFKKKRKNE